MLPVNQHGTAVIIPLRQGQTVNMRGGEGWVTYLNRLWKTGGKQPSQLVYRAIHQVTTILYVAL